MPEEFLDDFTAFTYQRGIEHIAAGGDIDALYSSTLFNAYKAQHQDDQKIQLHHYFPRHEWMAAVNARDPTNSLVMSGWLPSMQGTPPSSARDA